MKETLKLNIFCLLSAAVAFANTAIHNAQAAQLAPAIVEKSEMLSQFIANGSNPMKGSWFEVVLRVDQQPDTVIRTCEALINKLHELNKKPETALVEEMGELA